MAADRSSFPQSPASRAAQVKMPISAYLTAVVSAVFVTFGSFIAIVFSSVIVGEWIPSLPTLVQFAIPFFAMALGLLSGWQSLRQAKRKAIKKHAAEFGDLEVVCQGCGEAVLPDADACPMCGVAQL